jgi:hypothetical protein
MWRTSKPNKAKDNASNITWNVFIAPNPTNDKVTVSFSNKHPEGNIELYDLYGKLLQTVSFTQDVSTNVLALDTYAAGIYILKINTHDNTAITKKVVLIK